MSPLTFCCCEQHRIKRGRHHNERKLPIYLTPFQKGPMQFESLARHEKTVQLMNDLARRRATSHKVTFARATPESEKNNDPLSKAYWGFQLKRHKEANVEPESKIIQQRDDPATGAMLNLLSSSGVDHTVNKKIVKPVVPRRVGIASMEGQLLKFTNVLKGYQMRWVVLDPEAGTLKYFEKRSHRKEIPRGIISLQTADLSESLKEANGFIVTAGDGETFKLKAHNAKEKDLWCERIKAVVVLHNSKLLKLSKPRGMFRMCGLKNPMKTKRAYGGVIRKNDELNAAKNSFKEAEDFCKHLDNTIMDLPDEGTCISPFHTELLVLKATSNATLQCIQDLITLLQIAQLQLDQCSSITASTVIERSTTELSSRSGMEQIGAEKPDLVDEVEDEAVTEEKISDKSDDRSVILHLLSQLKIGMDLTKVTLPTSILERRSLLELFTDCMSHPDLFIAITGMIDPESRFLATLEWYLTSFHCGRLGSAKKPYNPIIGETFHCSWRVPTEFSENIILTYTAEQASHHPPVTAFYVECQENGMKMNASIHTKSKFLGMSVGVSMIGKVRLLLEEHGEEYVFSLPSAYARSIFTVPWVELGDKLQMTCEKTGYMANITFHTKPFYGGKLHHLTAEAKNVNTGDVICKVSGEWNNSFEFTYPRAGIKDYCLLHLGQRELTKIAHCHRGGRLHFRSVTNSSSALQKKKRSILQGKSSGPFYSEGLVGTQNSRIVEVNKLKVYRKNIRPLVKQTECESRRLWLNVTNNLELNEVAKATEYKLELERYQRAKEERYRSLNMEYEPKFFRRVDGVWLYKLLPDSFVKNKN